MKKRLTFPFSNRASATAGFSLFEMVLVLSILAFLTINVAIAIRNGFRTRARIEEQVQDMSQVRDSLRVMERDFNLAFHYRDLEEEFRSEIKKAAATPTPSGQTAGVPPLNPFGQPQGQPQQPPDPKEAERKQNRADPTTQFVGGDNEVSFVTLNVGRVAGDAKQADFIKVGYALKSCKDLVTGNDTKCLIRREATQVEGDVTKGGIEVVLVRDVTEFSLRYLGKTKQDWVKEWNSLGNDVKGLYPDAVEINLTVERESERNTGKTNRDRKKKKISMQTVAAIRFPNNENKTQQTPGSPSP